MAQQPFLDPNAIFTTPVSPTGGVDPELLAAIKRGQAASGELSQLQEGSPMAKALRMSEAELGGVQGRGLSATAPGIVEALATLGQRYQGNKQLRQMEEQAKLLRGEVAAGEAADLTAEQQAAAYGEEQKRENALAQMRFQEGLAETRAKRDKELAQLKAEQRGNLQEAKDAERLGKPELFVDPKTNQTRLVQRTRGEGLVDSDTGEKIDTNQWKRIDQHVEDLNLGSKVYGLPDRVKKEYATNDQALRGLNRVQTAAKQLSKEDIASLNKPFVRTVIASLTPSQFENWAAKNLTGISEKGRRYLEELNLFSSDIRHEKFGSALTWNENAIANAFLPSASDITFEDMLARQNMFGEGAMDNIRSLSETYGRPQMLKNLPWKPMEPPADETFKPITEAQFLELSNEEREEYLRRARGG